MQKLKNNEARPKFTGSYKKKRCQSEKSEHFTTGIPGGGVLWGKKGRDDCWKS